MTKIHTHGGDVYRYPDVLDFSANCNPFGMPEGVKKAAAEAVRKAEYYPDVQCERLRKALEEAEGVPYRQIICGNGAADLIFGLVLAKKPEKALLLAPSFAEYEQALDSVGCEVRHFVLKEEENFVPGEQLLEQITEDLDMMFFCNPNNPTGVVSDVEFIKKIAEKCKEKKVFLVVDECFTDFLEIPENYTMKPYLKEFPEMLLVKAFTKKYAMAGLRLGYGLCESREIHEKMKAVMQPWNVSVVAQEAGIAALKETEYAEETLKKIRQERIFLLEEMKKAGFKVYGSQANYIFFKGPENFWETCLKLGVNIRDCSNYEGLSQGFYRIAVRTREENEKLIQVWNRILE